MSSFLPIRQTRWLMPSGEAKSYRQASLLQRSVTDVTAFAAR